MVVVLVVGSYGRLTLPLFDDGVPVVELTVLPVLLRLLLESDAGRFFADVTTFSMGGSDDDVISRDVDVDVATEIEGSTSSSSTTGTGNAMFAFGSTSSLGVTLLSSASFVGQ